MCSRDALRACQRICSTRRAPPAQEHAQFALNNHGAIRPARRYNAIQAPPSLYSESDRAPGHLDGELITVKSTRDPSRDLLFGLLALQTGLINQTQLVAAFHAWTQARDRPMDQILAEQGALQSPCLTLVEGLERRKGSSHPFSRPLRKGIKIVALDLSGL